MYLVSYSNSLEYSEKAFDTEQEALEFIADHRDMYSSMSLSSLSDPDDDREDSFHYHF